MNKKVLRLALLLAIIFTFIAIGSAMATPKPLSARISRDATSCGIVWFNNHWKPIWIEGTGYILQHDNDGFVITCDFTLDLNDPKLLSREQFCAVDWAKFMCQGDGALVDNRTTCNIEGVEVHNGIVVAGPSGEGKFVCHVK